MILFDSDYIHLEYYAAHHVLVSQWYSGCSSRQYREAVTMTSHYIQEMNIPYAISDRRLLPPLSPEDIAWSVNEYIQTFVKLPLKRVAIINSFDEHAAEQLHYFINNPQFPLPFQMRAFDDLTSAYEWLVSVPA